MVFVMRWNFIKMQFINKELFVHCIKITYYTRIVLALREVLAMGKA